MQIDRNIPLSCEEMLHLASFSFRCHHSTLSCWQMKLEAWQWLVCIRVRFI